MEDSPNRAVQLSSDARDGVDGALDLQVRDAAAGVRTAAEDLLFVEAQFAANGLYRKTREKWLPFLQPAHVDRNRRSSV